MKKILFLTKMLLAAVMLCVGQNAWGAGYTRTLTDGLEVTGYKAKAFYDFQNNSPAVLPTSGDLRYRAYEKGGYWGLHNFGGSGRSATATIPVAVGDILVIQNYSGYTSTINRGSENSTLSSATGYQVFDIETAGDDVTFSVPRYGGIVAAFVMEKDNTVATGDYTINYKASGVTVKTVSGTGLAVGTEIAVLNSFFEGGKKYVTDGGQASSLTIAKGENNLDINVTEAAKYSCMLNLLASDKPLSSIGTSVYEGESETVYYKKAYLYEGKWYFVAVNAETPGYGVAFNNVSAAAAESITTFEAWDNVVYFAEAEDLTLGAGSWAANGTYLNWRSNGMSKRLAKNSYIYTDEIAAGVYNVTLQARNNRSAGDGTETISLFLRDEEGNLTDLATSFPGWARGGYEGAKTATITIPNDGKKYSIVVNNNTEYTSNLELDFLYVESVSTVPVEITSAGWATLYTPCALDFSGVDGLEAYTASLDGEVVTLSSAVSNVPAKTGVVLKGTTKTYYVPVLTSSSTEQGDLQGSATEATAYDAIDGYTLYVLTTVDEGANVQFNPVTEGSIAAGKAFLKVSGSSSARALRVVFDGITGVANVEAAAEAKAQDGKFIENGKIVIVKNGVKYNAAGQQVK